MLCVNQYPKIVRYFQTVQSNIRLTLSDSMFFFDALASGIIYHSTQKQLPSDYEIRHVYHNLISENSTKTESEIVNEISRFYSGQPDCLLKFGSVKALNTNVYNAKIFGMKEFASSITVVHEFYGWFKVTSMLKKQLCLIRQ